MKLGEHIVNDGRIYVTSAQHGDHLATGQIQLPAQQGSDGDGPGTLNQFLREVKQGSHRPPHISLCDDDYVVDEISRDLESKPSVTARQAIADRGSRLIFFVSVSRISDIDSSQMSYSHGVPSMA